MVHHTSRLFLLLAMTLLASAGIGACGPVESLVVINQANLAIEAAEQSEASRYAPYEYYSAKELIHKAREEMHYSDFEVAVDLAIEARDRANKAREKAITHPERTTIPPAGGATGSQGERLE